MRIAALTEVGEPARAAVELDALPVVALPAHLRGRHHLLRAGLQLGSATPDDARRWVEAARGEPLAPDDQAYADALLADTTPDAVRHLERAVALNSHHVQARGLLAHLLLLLGRVDDAVRVAEQSRAVFTDHPAFPAVLAFGYAARGEDERSASALAALAGLRPAEEVDDLRTLVAVLPVLHSELRWRLYGEEYGHPRAIPEQLARLAAVVPRIETALPRWFAALRLPPALRTPIAATFRAYHRQLFGVPPGQWRVVPAGELAAFADAVRRHPEGVATLLLATGLSDEANATPEGASHLDDFRRRLAEAAAVFLAAADRTGWVEVRDVALDHAAVYYAVAGKPKRSFPVQVQAEWVTAGADAARRRWAVGPVPSQKLRLFVKLTVTAGRYPFARVLLDDLATATPDDLAVEKLRADLEHKAGNFALALTAAEKYLVAYPKDEDVKAIRDDCRRPVR